MLVFVALLILVCIKAMAQEVPGPDCCAGQVAVVSVESVPVTPVIPADVGGTLPGIEIDKDHGGGTGGGNNTGGSSHTSYGGRITTPSVPTSDDASVLALLRHLLALLQQLLALRQASMDL